MRAILGFQDFSHSCISLHTMLEDIEPPAYDLAECSSSPIYSISAGSSERVIQYEPFRRTGCPDCDWIFETDHMTINMGSRVWGLFAPSYGLNGRIEGTIKFRGEQCHVERVTATLEGYITSSAAQRSPGETRVLIISRTIPLYVAHIGNSFEWNEEQTFSIPIPAEVNVQESISQLPPSFAAHYQTSACEVSYTVKFDMTRRGLRRHESKTVPILYLPKTRPSEPPLAAIPRPMRELSETPVSMYDRVKTVKLSAYWPTESKRQSKSASKLESFSKSVYFSLPAPQCFTSGESVPFTLSLVFPDGPVLATLLTRNIRIVLLKRMRLWRKGQRDPIVRDMTLATAHLRYINEYSEGVSLLRGVVQAGMAGRESSWRVDGVAEVQYILRVMLHPPDNIAEHLPSFRHDEILQITTDYWGTLERELTATGGTPTPALGLASDLRRPYSY